MKKDSKKGANPIIKASCGQQGCDTQPYIMPYSGTKEDFSRHAKEKFKTFKQAA